MLAIMAQDMAEAQDAQTSASTEAGPSTQPWPQAPQFHFAQKQPTRLTNLVAGNFNPPDLKGKRKAIVPNQQFWRRAKWSPEGTHVLAQTDSHELDLFEWRDSDNTPHHVFRISSPTTLLDWIWYPLARSADPSTFCFAISCRDVPVRLVDALTGATRATYGIENHVERFVGPNAMVFSCDGASLYCGHATSLSIFSLSDVGRNTCSTMSLVPTKAAQGPDLQKGIISCMAVAPCYAEQESGTTPVAEYLAVGTFNGTVGVYQRTTLQTPGKWIDAVKQPTEARRLCLAGWIETDGTGVMQTTFHPTAPHILFLRTRGAYQPIKAYDLRYINSTPRFVSPPSDGALLAKFLSGDAEGDDSHSRYQQRVWFDVDWTAQWLVSGDHSGKCSVWSLTQESDSQGDADQRRSRTPVAQWQLQQDTIGSVSFHPLRPYLLTVSGSRIWSDDALDESDSDSDGSSLANSRTWLTKEAHLSAWECSQTVDQAQNLGKSAHITGFN